MHAKVFLKIIIVLALFEFFVVAYPQIQGIAVGHEFLLFHSFAESVVAFLGIFIGLQCLAFARKEQRIDALLLSGGFFAAASLDILHLLSYGGMPTTVIFPSANTSEFFWLMARGVLGAALFAAALFSRRTSHAAAWTKIILGAAALFIVGVYAFALIFGTDIPKLVGVTGGTQLRAVNEIIVVTLYIFAGIFYAWRFRVDREILYAILMFFTLTIFSEANLILYLGPYFLSNWLTHAYTVLAYLVLGATFFSLNRSGEVPLLLPTKRRMREARG